MTTETKFEVGRTYEMTSVCDHNCKWTYEVIKRTKKFVTLLDSAGIQIRRGITVYSGEEQVLPLGSYSMAPILGAEKVVEEYDPMEDFNYTGSHHHY